MCVNIIAWTESIQIVVENQSSVTEMFVCVHASLLFYILIQCVRFILALSVHCSQLIQFVFFFLLFLLTYNENILQISKAVRKYEEKKNDQD